MDPVQHVPVSVIGIINVGVNVVVESSSACLRVIASSEAVREELELSASQIFPLELPTSPAPARAREQV